MYKQKMYSYRLFGLNILSEIKLILLSPAEGDYDVVVRYGAVPSSLSHVVIEGPYFQRNQDQVLLRLEASVGARYAIINGKEIIIETLHNANPEQIQDALISAAIKTILYQRNCYTLHASAISTPVGAIGFAGHSGAGKSTLATTFFQRGYRVLTDDICAIKTDESNAPMVYPGAPYIKLWSNTVEQLELPAHSLAELTSNRGKHCLLLNEAFERKAQPLHTLYILTPNNHLPCGVQPLTGMTKVRVLRDYFGVDAADIIPLDKQNTLHHHLTYLSHHVRICKVIRSRKGFDIDKLADLIEMDFLSHQHAENPEPSNRISNHAALKAKS